MLFEELICPMCGAAFWVPKERENTRCFYCAYELSVKETIQNLVRQIERST